MVEFPIRPPRSMAEGYPYLEPALRHLGWLTFFLLLAPIVGPRGYGTVALALSGIAIAERLLTETAIGALVGRDTLEDRHRSTALVTIIVIGAGLTLMLRAAAGAMTAMLDDAVLGDIFQSLTLLPLLGGLTVIPTASLRRAGRRGPVVAAAAAGTVAGGGLAVALAWAGTGPWSLVAQIVAQRLVECAVLWATSHERIGIAWSSSHFVDLLRSVRPRVLCPALPQVACHAQCLIVGLVLGPIATGLYMLASRLAEAVLDIFLAQPPSQPCEGFERSAQRACRPLLPALLVGVLLPIAVPPLLDVRWWGAILPAQILLLASVPAAISFVRAACTADPSAEARWRTAEILGGLVAIALVASHGLVSSAAAELAQAMAVAGVSLWLIGQRVGNQWRAMLLAAVPPCAAATGSFVLLAVTAPLGGILDPLPAFCIMTASGWLCYLLIWRVTMGVEQGPIPPAADIRLAGPA
jgi:polysaccharide transporter, PST family